MRLASTKVILLGDIFAFSLFDHNIIFSYLRGGKCVFVKLFQTIDRGICLTAKYVYVSRAWQIPWCIWRPHFCKMYGRLRNVREPAKKTSRVRTKHPSQEDWNLHKNEIKRLYVDGNLTLREVAQQMEKRFSFRATYAI
jgi:Clr5 domain